MGWPIQRGRKESFSTKPPEEVRIELVRGWLASADNDLRAGRAIASAALPSYETASFHAQQAVEKALKALLVRHQIDFTKTHDLGELRMLAAGCGLDPAVVPPEVAALTPYAVDARYPRSSRPPVTREETMRHLETAAAVFNGIRDLLVSYLSRR